MSSPDEAEIQRRTRAAIAAVWQQTRPQYLARVEVLEAAVAALAGGDLPPGLRDQAADAAHKLAGALGTYGFPEASRTAKAVEGLLEPGAGLGPEQAPELSALVAALRRSLETA